MIRRMIRLRALKDKIAWRATAPSILIVLNSFVWYILTYAVFSSIVNELPLLQAEKLELFTIYFVGIGVSAILGSKFFPRLRNTALSLWLFMGVVSTLLLTIMSSDGMIANALLALFFGTSIGVGLPSCLSYFADSTSVENRGFAGGIIWSTVGFTVLILAFLINMLGQWETVIILAVWRLFGGIAFLFLKKKNTKLDSQKSPSYLELIRKKEILLYLFPWVMFCFINFAEAPILEGVYGEQVFAFVQLAESAFVGFVAIIGGFIADITGRKRIVIAGFVMLGIEYAALSAFNSPDSPATLYLFLILDGITWGLLASVFFTVIWGDLGENHEKEKYYALGGIPYLLGNFLYILFKTYAVDVSPTAAFSFASFFLFLAVLPLMYAPETLPEKKIKERELKKYIEKARKEAEKIQEKEAE
jgi:MFS family permease